MTASDPGLTDLIAADLKSHTWGHGYENAAHEDHTFDGGCKVCRGDVDAIAARALLVVGQHTDGWTAELEARIAEAQSLCNATGRYNAARQKHWNIRVFACDVLAALKGRAALEGEQQ